MDHDTLELVRLLCCRAGMLMEDISALAVAPPSDEVELQRAVQKLGMSIDRMRSMVDAAKALMI